jgi:hypothetical protein
MEILGLLFAFAFLNIFLLIAAAIIVVAARFFFPKENRPNCLIRRVAFVPFLSLYYIILCSICFTLFVSGQPGMLGDFNESIPHGYFLTGLNKMPEFAYFESTPPMMRQPPLLGGVRRLELDGEVVYGAYGHIDGDGSFDERDKDHGYFIFDTRTGAVKNVDTIEQLDAAAGHPVYLVESQFFRSQEPYQIWLRRIEHCIYFGPPILVFLYCLYRLVRFRIRGGEDLRRNPDGPGTPGLNN